MKQATVRRRDLFHAAMMASAAVAATSTLAPKPVAAATTSSADKRKARYQANSAEVQNFYRVNRYPAR